MVNFWSIASQGMATVVTSAPVSSSKGFTSSSKLAAESPITQTVSGPAAAGAEGEPPGDAAGLLGEGVLGAQAASGAARATAATRPSKRGYFMVLVLSVREAQATQPGHDGGSCATRHVRPGALAESLTNSRQIVKSLI